MSTGFIERNAAARSRRRAVLALALPAIAAIAIVLTGSTAPAGAADTSAPFWPTGTPSLVASTGAGFVRVGGEAGWPVATDTPSPFVGYYEIRRSTTTITASDLGSFLGTVESSATRRYDDYSGIPGESYHYAVIAVDSAGNRSTSSAFAVKFLTTASYTTMPGSQVPHNSYSDNSSLCRDCHYIHGAAGPKAFRKSAEEQVCFTCHDGTGATTDIQTIFATKVSGHVLDDTPTVPGPGLTQNCSSCHSVHYPPATRPKLYKTPINGAAVTGNNYTWCESCHDDAYSWVVPTYPYPSGGISPVKPQRDASGYPTLGTYPGRTTYNNTTWNAHNPTTSTNVIWPSSGRPSGDCRNCHASHGNTAKYDALVAAFRPSSTETTESDRLNGTYAELCLTCHDGNPSARNIKQFVTYDATKTGDDYTGGHRVFTSGGNLPPGAPLPCYDCHNPHGTKGNNGVNPNKDLISDEQWSGIDTSTTAGVVNFCFKCHLPWEYAAGSGQPEANTIPSGETTIIEGLDRRVAANKLSLPNVASAHGKANHDTPTSSCYDCHGVSYAAPSASSGYNVHRPNRGGGCTSCHASAQDGGDGAPTRRAVVSEFTGAGHHVKPGAVTDKDCGVCHREGNASDGSINATYHKNNLINLRNPDSGDASGLAAFVSLTRDTTTKTIEPTVTAVQNNLCLTCHDSNGANSALARVPGGTAQQPFSSNTTNAANMFSALATTNAFHHSVRGSGTNNYAAPTATNGWVITMVAPWNQLNNEHNVISCFDCHVVTAGHGGTYADSGRTDFSTYTGQRDNCIRCHKTSVYESVGTGSRFPDHKQGQHKLTGGNTYGCRGCHAGLVDDDKNASVWNGAPGNIHGGNFTWPAGSKSPGSVTQQYMYGGWLGGWVSGTCYGGNCNHTNGKNY